MLTSIIHLMDFTLIMPKFKYFNLFSLGLSLCNFSDLDSFKFGCHLLTKFTLKFQNYESVYHILITTTCNNIFLNEEGGRVYYYSLCMNITKSVYSLKTLGTCIVCIFRNQSMFFKIITVWYVYQ